MRKDTIIVFIFIFVIGLPLVGLFVKSEGSNELHENRELTKPPRLMLAFKNGQEFSKEFTKYFNDNFGFRSSLIKVNYNFTYRLLKTSSSEQVIIGKDGWLFNVGEKEIKSFFGLNNIPINQLERMAFNLEQKREMLAAKGIKYLFVISPNKSSMYPEYLPIEFNNVTSNARTDNFIEYMRDHTSINMLDLRKPLIRHKETALLYYKNDTHWNNYGAFFGYQEIINSINKWFVTGKIQQLTDYKIANKKIAGGDLALMIGGTAFMTEEETGFLPLVPRTAMKIGDSFNPNTPEIYINQKPRLPRVIIFRGSFFDKLTPFISEHFQYAKHFKGRWGLQTPIIDIINECRPDIIIEEVVERVI